MLFLLRRRSISHKLEAKYNSGQLLPHGAVVFSSKNCSSLNCHKQICTNPRVIMRWPTTLAAAVLLLTSLAHASRGLAVSDACGAVKGRLVDTLTTDAEYVEFRELERQISSVDGSQHPVVLVDLANVPCAAGCCFLDVFVRPHTTDTSVLEQVIFGDEYQFLQSSLSSFLPKTILDAGGNIGLASVLFALRYPEARIVVLEPNSGNFKVLELNTRRFGNIAREHVALWPRNSYLKVTDVDKSTRKGEWSFEVNEVANGEGDVIGVNFEHLMAKHDVDVFDMAKIDIEGSEKAVFDDYRHHATGDLRHWVRSTQVFVLETHDDIAPGAQAAVETAMNARGDLASSFRSGELRIWKFD